MGPTASAGVDGAVFSGAASARGRLAAGAADGAARSWGCRTSTRRDGPPSPASAVAGEAVATSRGRPSGVKRGASAAGRSPGAGREAGGELMVACNSGRRQDFL